MNTGILIPSFSKTLLSTTQSGGSAFSEQAVHIVMKCTDIGIMFISDRPFFTFQMKMWLLGNRQSMHWDCKLQLARN